MPSFIHMILLHFVVAITFSGLWISSAWAESNPLPGKRFFYSGNGHIQLTSEKNGRSFSGMYRNSLGVYNENALDKICRVFDAPCRGSDTQLSLRLLEYLDYLEDHLHPGTLITITSGYRNPEYNTGLRKRGGLAAKASLHQYGMAADLKMAGVPANKLWQHIKDIGFGGAGYYHGETVHIDVGPARSWDETSSGVGTGISDDNKLIRLVTDFDIYSPGMGITLRFIRMTAFPIGVNPEFSLFRKGESDLYERVLEFSPFSTVTTRGPCPKYNDISEMASFQWKLPPNLIAGRYFIRARFCDRQWAAMPEEIETPGFEIVK